MKQLTKQIALLERVDQLIRLKATGRPKNLAERLNVSQATVFRMIETMKELNAPVYYDLARQSYAYSEPTAFKCGFFVEALDEEAQRDLTGGYGFKNIQRLLKF
ncbi:Hypothetical protein I595_231 [Croceitalea dokdonensis DOKDO 023]|uniref:Uncharacterized protein n=1 Tax=Croceitalea dokdonensis DOKDO 023 TaxID=1300341 RepID=A0A0P7B229_9FLAO|nr:HTH domain-containing protein [Croceitalea dokdonensis]KPM33328.1 Hypothetical protein I595_231 [Croceitalea dokdonensis DOKDO 023]